MAGIHPRSNQKECIRTNLATEPKLHPNLESDLVGTLYQLAFEKWQFACVMSTIVSSRLIDTKTVVFRARTMKAKWRKINKDYKLFKGMLQHGDDFLIRSVNSHNLNHLTNGYFFAVNIADKFENMIEKLNVLNGRQS